MGAVWHAQESRYTLKDGSVVAAAIQKKYHRDIFEPKIPKAEVRAILERQDAQKVRLSLPCGFSTKHPKKFVIHVFEFKDGARQKKALASLERPTEKTDSDSWGCENSTVFNLSDGAKVQLTCEMDNETQESDVFMP